jgi:hypothetical protein
VPCDGGADPLLKGPLSGLVGPVVRWGGRDVVVATVRFLGRGTMIGFQDWQVEGSED